MPFKEISTVGETVREEECSMCDGQEWDQLGMQRAAVDRRPPADS